MIQTEKERKKFQFRFPFLLDSGKKIPKKISKKFQKLKNLFSEIFLAKTRWDRLRKRNKYFCHKFCSYPTRRRKFQKRQQKNSKIKKLNSSITSIQYRLKQAGKVRKKFKSRIPFLPQPGCHFQKKQLKNSKNRKTSFRRYFNTNGDEIG